MKKLICIKILCLRFLFTTFSVSAAPYVKDSKWPFQTPGCRLGKYPGIPQIIGIVPSTASSFALSPVLGGNCSKYSKNGTFFLLNPKTGKPIFSIKLIGGRGIQSSADAFAPLSDGSFLLGGSFYRIGSQVLPGIVKLTSSGVVDSTFAPPIPTVNDSSAAGVKKIVPLPWGPVFLSGSFRYENGGTQVISRGTFNSTTGALDSWLKDIEGALKTELGASAVMLKDAYLLKNQSVLFSVLYVIEPNTYLFKLVRFLPTGARDSSFNFTPLPLTGILSDRTSEGLPGTFTMDVDYRMAGPFLEQSSGHIILSHVYFSGAEVDELVRVAPDGTYLGSFSPILPGTPSRISVLSDDSVVTYIYRGYKRSYLLKFNSEGGSLGRVRFKSFGKAKYVTGIYPESDNLLVETLTQQSFQVTGVEKYNAK